MNLFSLLIIAWKAIKQNKVRALLTMLGIIIGVAAVITMLAIGEGSTASIKEEISSMGSNMVTIRPGEETHGGVRMGRDEMQTLTLDDYKLIKNNAQYISSISPEVSSKGQTIFSSNNWPTTIYGVTPGYLDIKIVEVVKGSMFTENEVLTASKVIVIGQTIVENIFPNGEDPIGQTIRFNKIPFKVIGVLEEKGENTFGQDQDDVILAPYTTVQKRILATTHIQSILASASSEDVAEEAVTEVTEIMRESHQIVGEEDDFHVRSMDELISTLSSTSEMLTVLLVAIASISLVIGGIGIMNIMYVSVKERTREIGLRMAVGGKGKDILFQFLIEAFLISITGGLIGVFIGVLLTLGISSLLNWPTIITSYSVILSFFVCALTGVFFGWYPAKKAADLDPIQALRYE